MRRNKTYTTVQLKGNGRTFWDDSPRLKFTQSISLLKLARYAEVSEAAINRTLRYKTGAGGALLEAYSRPDKGDLPEGR